MKSSSFFALLSAVLLTLVVVTPAAARPSLGSIDQKLDALITGIGEPAKVVVSGDVLESSSSLAGPFKEYVIPAGKRFFIREIACRSPSFTAVLNTRRFGLSITALISNPNGGSMRQTIAATQFIGDDAPLLATIQTSVYESSTYLDAGDRLVLDLFRREGGNDGFINRFACVVTGYMTDL